MNQKDFEKIVLWVLLVLFSFITLILSAPYIGYVILALGITIPAYLLYKKNKE